MMARMWRKRNTPPLLVGLQASRPAGIISGYPKQGSERVGGKRDRKNESKSIIMIKL